jgi:hypothetical protein
MKRPERLFVPDETTIWRRYNEAHGRIGTLAHDGKRLNPFGLAGDQPTSGSSRKGKPRDAQLLACALSRRQDELYSRRVWLSHRPGRLGQAIGECKPMAQVRGRGDAFGNGVGAGVDDCAGASANVEGLEMHRQSRDPVERADYRMQQRDQFRDHCRKGTRCGLEQPRQGVCGQERPRPGLGGLRPGDPA